MATGLYPYFNDRKFNLLKKAAWNVYNWAIASGASGLDAPDLNDTEDILTKKLVYYTAALAEA